MNSPHIEIVIVRDSDGDNTLHYFADGTPVEPAELNIDEIHIDPGRSGADEEWQESMEEKAANASPAAAACIREIVSYCI